MRKLFAFSVVLLLAVAAWMGFCLAVPAGSTQQTLVEFKAGSSARHIASELKQAGIGVSLFIDPEPHQIDMHLYHLLQH